MERRDFLALAGLGSVAILGGVLEIVAQTQNQNEQNQSALSQQEIIERGIPGLITQLPATSVPNAFAWTVDDASESETLARYLERVAANSISITFFVSSSKHSWVKQAEALHPLIKSGQIQLANHGHRHFDLTRLKNSDVLGELSSCHNFLLDTFGVDARPFWRPAYRKIDKRVASIAAEIGYTTPTLWNKNLLNASPSTSAEHTTSRFASEATAGAILLDHMHGLQTDAAFEKALSTLHARKLKTMTLREAIIL